jgi:hypothetical protein
MKATEKKIEWLNKATSEKLMDRYDLAYYQCTKTDNDEEWNEWVKLAREEILKRLNI